MNTTISRLREDYKPETVEVLYLRTVGVAAEFSGKRPLTRRPAIPRCRRALTQLTSAVRPSPCGQWRPAHDAAHPDPQRRNAGQRGQGWGSSAGPGRAPLRGIGRADRAKACSIAASSNTSRLGSSNAATATMTSGRCRSMWSGSFAATSTAESLGSSPVSYGDFRG